MLGESSYHQCCLLLAGDAEELQSQLREKDRQISTLTDVIERHNRQPEDRGLHLQGKCARGCVYVYSCAFICVCARAGVYACVPAYLCEGACVREHKRVCVCAFVRMLVCAYGVTACVFVYVHAYVCVNFSPNPPEYSSHKAHTRTHRVKMDHGCIS